MSTPFTNTNNAEDIAKRFQSTDYLSAKHPDVYRGPIVRSESFHLTLEWIRKYYNKIAIDWKELQRFFEPWEDEAINSYLTTVLNGMEKKDLFQLVDIETQIDWLKEKLTESLSDNDKEKFKYCLQYFEEWKDTGAKWLCIDGQHRLFYLHQYLTSKISFETIGTYSKEWFFNNRPYKISETKFESYIPQIQDYINDISLQTTIYTAAPLDVYSMIFSSSNKGRAVHSHEDRMILNNTDFCAYLKDKILSSSFRDEFTSYIKFTSPSIAQKGDTYFVTRMFPWWCSQKDKSLITIPNNYNFKDSENDFLFEVSSMPSGYIAEFDKVVQMVVTCVLHGKPNKKINQATLTNFFYYVWKFTEGGIVDKKYTIEVPGDFLTEFLLKEDMRKKRTEFATNPDGSIVLDAVGMPIENAESYTRKCKQQTFQNFKKRIAEMENDIYNDFQELHNTGIIKPKGSRESSLSTFDVAAANDFKDGKGNDITSKDLYSQQGKSLEINEIEPVSAGGKRTLDNVNLLTSQDNKAEYNKIQKYNK
jgi:hypothetical protein